MSKKIKYSIGIKLKYICIYMHYLQYLSVFIYVDLLINIVYFPLNLAKLVLSLIFVCLFVLLTVIISSKFKPLF